MQKVTCSSWAAQMIERKKCVRTWTWVLKAHIKVKCYCTYLKFKFWGAGTGEPWDLTAEPVSPKLWALDSMRDCSRKWCVKEGVWYLSLTPHKSIHICAHTRIQHIHTWCLLDFLVKSLLEDIVDWTVRFSLKAWQESQDMEIPAQNGQRKS